MAFKRYALLGKNGRICAYTEVPETNDPPEGFTELTSMPEGIDPEKLGNYLYKDGSFTYSSRKEAAQLLNAASFELFEGVLDLQIRTLTLELLTETEV